MRKLLILLLLLSTASIPQAWAIDEELRNPTIADFVSPQSYNSVRISPDGRHVVALGYNGQFNSVLLAEASTMRFETILKPSVYSRKPRSVHWIDNELLAVNFGGGEAASFDVSGKQLAKLGAGYIGRVGRRSNERVNEVLVFRNDDYDSLNLVDPRTGDSRRYPVSLPSGRMLDWAFDAEGNLRAATTRDTTFWTRESSITQWYRSNATAEWQQLEKGPVTQDAWFPLYASAEPDTLVVQSRHGRDTWGIFRYNTRTRELGELMARHPSEDIHFVSSIDNEVFARVITNGLKQQTHWFDARWAQLQLSIDKALPKHINMLSGDPHGKVLVFSYSDVDPGRWLVFDTAALTLQEIAPAKPRIRVEAMQPMQTLQYPARDGLQIPAYLTVPAGEGPWPLVVFIHGGPTARDTWGWDAELQLLALRGYAVFQPQFRGSTGFGARFEQAGRAQWGLAMQDDITDGVKHLIAKGIARPNRICISGASYGGYAALWGLVKTPELYRCGVSFAGVTDIDKMLRDRSDVNRDPALREMLRFKLDVMSTDKPLFEAVSPLKHADRIQAPVLLAHGENDERVFPSHSKLMVAELKARGKEHEWLLFEREGHGLSYSANQWRYFDALLKFLDRHIGPSSKAALSDAAPAPAAAASSAQ